MGGRKGDREIILGVVIEYIFKYIKKIFAEKYYKMVILLQFFQSILNLRRSAARTITGENLKLEKK